MSTKKNNDGIIDRLTVKENNSMDGILTEHDIILPEVCIMCKNNIICSVIPSLIQMGKIGIILSIESCPYNTHLELSNEQ